MSGEKMS
jgi:hypothetical protein